LVSSNVRSVDKPITLVLEQTTTLRVGDLAKLHIPSDSRCLHSEADGAWHDALVVSAMLGTLQECKLLAVRQLHPAIKPLS
jgi:hypothetical protein